MIYNSNSSKQVADFLLEIKAVILKPSQPFTWASGWKSPIYCDNRLILGYPEVRNFVKMEFSNLLKKYFPTTNVVAGVATAGIAHAVLIADHLELPMAYIRNKPKDHGTEKLIEGKMDMTSNVLVVEDLISTGKSSLQAIDAIQGEVNSVLGLISIFDYGFQIAKDMAMEKGVTVYSLCDYDTLIERAVEKNYIQGEDIETLKNWKMNPSVWGK